MAVSFIGGGNRENTTDLSQLTDKLYHIMLYRIEYTSPWTGFELTTLAVIGTGSCKIQLPYDHHHYGPSSEVSLFNFTFVFLLITRLSIYSSLFRLGYFVLVLYCFLYKQILLKSLLRLQYPIQDKNILLKFLGPGWLNELGSLII